ncbi:glycosyltransferase family 9 protein [Candidatus Woesearchaeota archaeon]|nr:glycosyltransferase family 9 protein [Candidatus Woesearchaeota archaeon]
MKILVIKLGAVGDVLRTTSILPALKEKYRDAGIDWVTKKESLELLKNNPYIEDLYSIENLEAESLPMYDLVLNPDDEHDACRLASQVKKKRLIGGYIENGNRAYTKDSALWFDMGLISRFGKQKADQLKIKNKRTYQDMHFEMFGLENHKKYLPILVLEKKYINFADSFAEKNGIKKNGLVIGINTGAGGRWQDKKLGIAETAELIDNLSKEIKNSKLMLFGGPEEDKRNKKIKKMIKTEIIDAGCDNSLMEFSSLINLCDVLITSDSLAMHIGTALKKKVVAFFYPTSAAEIMLPPDGIKIIGDGKDYCSYKTKCDYPPKWDIDEMVKAAKSLV